VGILEWQLHFGSRQRVLDGVELFSVSWPERTSGAFLVCNQWLHPLSSPTRINLLFLSKRLANSTWVTCQLWELWHQTILLLSKAFVTLLKWQIKSSSVSLLQQAGSLWLHSLVYYTQIDEVLLLHPSLLFVLSLLMPNTYDKYRKETYEGCLIFKIHLKNIGKCWHINARLMLYDN